MFSHTFRCLALIACLLAAPVTSAAGSQDEKESTEVQRQHSLKDFEWMVGRWEGEIEGSRFEDIWVEPAAGAMMGMFRLIDKQGRIILLEFEVIQETADGLEFRFRHFSKNLDAWEDAKEPLVMHVKRIEGNQIELIDPSPETPTKNQPHRVLIERRGDDEYATQTYVLREGKEVKILESVTRRAGAKSARGELHGETVTAGCGLCIFGMKGVNSCKLAIEVDGKHYLVRGSRLDDHGDAHAADGMCNVSRQAVVDGRIEDDVAVVTMMVVVE